MMAICLGILLLDLLYIYVLAMFYMSKIENGEYPEGNDPPKNPRLWEATRIILHAIGYIIAIAASWPMVKSYIQTPSAHDPVLTCLSTIIIDSFLIYFLAVYYASREDDGRCPGGSNPPRHPRLWKFVKVALYSILYTTLVIAIIALVPAIINIF